MVILELILVGAVFYFLNSNGRRNETRILTAQIHGLEKAVRDLAERVAFLQQGDGEVAAGPDRTARAAGQAGEHPVQEPVIAAAALSAVVEKSLSREERVVGALQESDSEGDLSGTAPGFVHDAKTGDAPSEYSAAFSPDNLSVTAEPLSAVEAASESVPLSSSVSSAPEDAASSQPPSLDEDGVYPESGFFESAAEDGEDFLFMDDLEEDAAPVLTGAEDPVRFAGNVSPGYLHALVNFIRGGNIWVAGGVIMLLLGFAFLAQLGIFPIELRIVGAAAAGMAMVAFGLYIRDSRRMYALVMQGGGIGVLYLSAFASAKLTDMLPPAAALVVMTALIVPAVALAVLQNAQVLSLFGFVGGFAAPILLSDGSGNYVALFSCYTLLNCGILAISRFRFWRWLNFAGALCTFVVTGYWGLTSYTAAMYPTTQPFLIIFALIYILITLGSVRRKEFSFGEPLDAVQACAIPFLAALFQWRIVMDIPHGLSISSMAFGAFFLLLATVVWKMWGERVRRLAEFYLANGVVLANLAVPLELSGNVTSTVWGVEGAVLFFFACRIRSARIKVVACLLQVVGMVAFLGDISGARDHTLLSTTIISLAALCSACFHKRDADDPRRETPEPINAWFGTIGLERLFALVGLLWWFGGLGLETARFAEQPLEMFFLAVGVSSAVLFFAGRKMGLREFTYASVLVPLATAALCLLVFSFGDYVHRSGVLPYQASLSAWQSVRLEAGALFRHNFLAGRGLAAWAAFAVTQAGMLRLALERMKPSRHAWWAGVFALEILLMLTSSGRGAALDFGLSRAWGHLASIFPALAYTAALTWLIKRYTEGRAKAFSPDHARVMGGTVPVILFSLLGVWLVFSFFSKGKPEPLPFFVPVFNPLELKQLLCVAIFAMWQRAISQVRGMPFVLPLPRLLLLLDAVLFVWLHSMLFRAIYHFTEIPMHRAWEHESFQVCLTALWGVWGMAHLVIGNRTRTRLLWVIGASLMLADTGKLFLVDLADKETLFRVISFFVMGGIFLLIGWLAPLPPSGKLDRAGEDDATEWEESPAPDEETDEPISKEPDHASYI